jgi:hypothetical protein
MRQHPTLLGVFECDDTVFYEADTEAKFRHFGIGAPDAGYPGFDG